MGADDQGPLRADQVIDGRYRVLRKLSVGGMGVVYEAEHCALGRRAVVKVIGSRTAGSPRARARFFAEARAAAAVRHPGIVEIYDLGTHDDQAYMAMELLEGEGLDERLRRPERMTSHQALQIALDLCDAMAAVHAVSVIHRDLKPSNVFLTDPSKHGGVRLKVLDFGIAKLGAELSLPGNTTETQEVFGTLQYMAPEQLSSSKHVDERADVYALGAILYECLAGKVAFAGDSYPELIYRVSTQPPDLTPLQHLPETLITLLLKALAKHKEQRFASVTALRAALLTLDRATLGPAPTGAVDAPPELAAAATVPAGTGNLTADRAAARARRNGWLTWAVGLGLCGAGGLLLLPGDNAERRAAMEQRSAVRPQFHDAASPPLAQPISPRAPEPEAALRPVVPAEAEREPVDAAASPLHELSVETRPRGARVSLDGIDPCVSPCKVALQNRKYRMRITLRGHEAWEQLLKPPFAVTLRVSLNPSALRREQ
jgi:hypothetical protein